MLFAKAFAESAYVVARHSKGRVCVICFIIVSSFNILHDEGIRIFFFRFENHVFNKSVKVKLKKKNWSEIKTIHSIWML